MYYGLCLWRYGQHQQAGLSPEEYGQRKTTVYSGLNMTIARDCGTNIIRMLLSCDYRRIIGTFWKANHWNN